MIMQPQQTWMGLKMVAHPLVPYDRPKIQLSDACPVTDRFRAEMNAWLDDFFGRERVVLRTGNSLFMNERTYLELLNQAHGDRRFRP